VIEESSGTAERKLHVNAIKMKMIKSTMIIIRTDLKLVHFFTKCEKGVSGSHTNGFLLNKRLQKKKKTVPKNLEQILNQRKITTKSKTINKY